MAIRRWPGAAAFDDLGNRVGRTIRQNWYLGFTSFGGPPVHFKIVRLALPTRVRGGQDVQHALPLVDCSADSAS